jgi:hypothetical protein
VLVSPPIPCWGAESAGSEPPEVALADVAPADPAEAGAVVGAALVDALLTGTLDSVAPVAAL